jgi:hypothetical protein
VAARLGTTSLGVALEKSEWDVEEPTMKKIIYHLAMPAAPHDHDVASSHSMLVSVFLPDTE